MTIPKLTDDAVSRLPLEAGRAELLEEIMSTVAPDRPQAEPTPLSRSRRRWLAPLAAAAVVAGLAGSSVWWQQQHDDEAAREAQPASQLDLAGDRGIVLDAPGWEVDSLGGDGVVFRKGDARLEITSYDADQYASYVEDREYIVDPPAPGQPIQVLGRPAQMWAYSSTDHTAIREVEDGHWLEFRADGLDQQGYLDVLGQLRMSSQEEFEASVPDDFVTEAERLPTALEIVGAISDVSGAEFPPGRSLSLQGDEAKDRYQFGAEVAGAYACAWFEEYAQATRTGKDARAAEAVRVLGTSRDWPILEEMDADGDYPEVVWENADTVAAGEVPEWFREGLGCPVTSHTPAP